MSKGNWKEARDFSRKQKGNKYDEKEEVQKKEEIWIDKWRESKDSTGQVEGK